MRRAPRRTATPNIFSFTLTQNPSLVSPQFTLTRPRLTDSRKRAEPVITRRHRVKDVAVYRSELPTPTNERQRR